MKDYRLDGMLENSISLDLETDLIQPGLVCPPFVLGSAAEWSNGQLIGQILDKAQVRALFDQIRRSPSVVLCGANIPFDLLCLAADYAKRGEDVMPDIFNMYDPGMEIVRGDCDGRVFEIQLAEPLDAIAGGHIGKHRISGDQIMNKETGRPGRYSLDTVTFEVQGREDAKVNDKFRMSYHMFHDVPISALPFEAVQYPIDDAKNTHGDALGQAGLLPAVWRHEWVQGPSGLTCRYCAAPADNAPQACMRLQRRRNLHELANQAYFAWASHLGSAWGLHVPQEEVDKLEAKVDASADAHAGPFLEAGILRKADDGYHEVQNVLKRLVAVAYGARDICPDCGGTGKVPSPATNGKTKINCKSCDGTCLRLPPEVPRSDGGGVGKSRDVLCESGDELLMDYGEQPSKKIKSTYIPLMRRGRACNVCGGTGVDTKYKKGHESWCTSNGESGYRPIPLIIRTDPLKETLRAAIEDGLHSMPRTGGVRECFCARPGYVYSSEDYAAGELVTLADACLRTVGWSKLAEALNGGLDPHLALAGTFTNKSYEAMAAAKKAKEKWLDPQRQVAKKSNFGFGGGMAELEFVLEPCRADPASFTPCANGPTVRDGVRGFNGTRPCIMMDGEDYCGRPGDKVLVYNDKPTGSPVCIRCLRCGKRAREMWFTQWPEMRKFFAHVKEQIKDVGPSGTPEINYPGMITRGGLGFCDGANGYFQMRLAKAAKAAFCQVQRECLVRTRIRSSEMMQSKYDGLESPLYGSRAILLFHDEIVAEHPESIASDAAPRVSEIMVEALRFQCPSMIKACKAEPTLMRRLFKGAEPVYDARGKLLVWEPKK